MRTNGMDPLRIAASMMAVALVIWNPPAGSAQSGSSGPPPGVIISGRHKEKFKPKPVRKALELRYAAISDAYRRKDPDTILRMRTSDFHAIIPSGEVWDAGRSVQYTRASFAQVETTLALTFEIGTIEVDGDTASAEIDQHWVRKQQKAGTARHVDTRVHQRETWLHRNGEWLLWRVDQIEPGPWIIDGKRVDPNKPFDPDARAFEPGQSGR